MSGGRTTKRHFAIFKAECQRLIKLWGLTDWDVRFAHDCASGLASCSVRVVARIITLRLNPKWVNDTPTNEEVLKCARHEVAHMVTAELIGMSEARCVTSDELEAATEATACRLERLLPR